MFQAKLTDVLSAAEQEFISNKIRHQPEYNANYALWLGGMLNVAGEWEWKTGRPMHFLGWRFPDSEPVRNEDPQESYGPDMPSSCISLKWFTSGSSASVPSGFYWQPKRCSDLAGFICRHPRKEASASESGNRTIVTPGPISSPGYPNGYPGNLDYWLHFIGGPKTRVVVHFNKIDLELQPQCLYDFVELRDTDKNDDKIVCGKHDAPMYSFDFISNSNEAFLHFHSDRTISESGFDGHWYAVDVSGCPHQKLSAREGTVSSPNYPTFLLPKLNCTTEIVAQDNRRIWLEFSVVDVGLMADPEANISLDLGNGRLITPFLSPNLLTSGVYLSARSNLNVSIRTGRLPRGRGFQATFHAVSDEPLKRFLNVPVNGNVLHLRHLNFPAITPSNVTFQQRFAAPLGYRLELQLQQVEFASKGNCASADVGVIEVRDNYADVNGSTWTLCEVRSAASPVTITSYLNSLQVWQRSGFRRGAKLNATIKAIKDKEIKSRLMSMSRNNMTVSVESCNPNPCQNNGKCVLRDGRRVCECKGPNTGLLCGLTECDLEPCIGGTCEINGTWFTCRCHPRFKGTLCEAKTNPCADNPCDGKGECHEKDGDFKCLCHAWWEGKRCDRKMVIPFKPLSERMLQEPFWLGLITVTAVLGVIGLFWCAKRHFPEKLEKLLAEEADRSRSSIYPSRGSSLRDQLTMSGATAVLAGSSGGVTAGSGSGGSSGGGSGGTGRGGAPGGGCRDAAPPRSLLGRLGIRKPSLLGLTTPPEPAARTFSLDDLLRAPPGRTPSPRKKRNNSTPTRQRSTVDAAEKKQILQHLVAPGLASCTSNGHACSSSNGEVLAMGDRCNSAGPSGQIASEDEDMTRETSFISIPVPVIGGSGELPPKLEKKVTFARLLNKVSAEMSSGSDRDANGPVGSPLLGVLSSSSNQASDSLSSLDIASSGEAGDRYINESAGSPMETSWRRPGRLFGLHRPDDYGYSSGYSYGYGDYDDGGATSDDSSQLTVSGASASVTPPSGALDSPPLSRCGHTIEVAVLDSTSSTSAGRSASILLEVPSPALRNLSPIREVPTPCGSGSLSPTPTPPLSPAPPGLRTASPQTFHPGSPPPQRSSNFLEVPGAPPRVVTMVKPTSLDVPSIMVTCSQSEPESDADALSPATSGATPSPAAGSGSSGPSGLTVPTGGGATDAGVPAKTMCYLSPFSMCSRGDRTASESNLSSSGYSSMASPGPSRCGSSNPLCSSEVEVDNEGSGDLASSPGATSVNNEKTTATSPERKMLRPSPGVALPLPTRRASEGTAIDAGFYPVLKATICRGRSDSETLSDDAVIESNDEGFATDPLHHQIDPLTLMKTVSESITDPALTGTSNLLLGSPLHQDSIDLDDAFELEIPCVKLLSPRLMIPVTTIGSCGDEVGSGDIGAVTCLAVPQNVVSEMLIERPEILYPQKEILPALQLMVPVPSIVVQGDCSSPIRASSPVGSAGRASPVSSRSESPLSDRSAPRFSTAFYGRPVPTTDSDGLYDVSSGSAVPQRRPSSSSMSSRRRERRPAAAAGRSPSRLLLDVPMPGSTPTHPNQRTHHHPRKPSPKRKVRVVQHQNVASSSSDESIHSMCDDCIPSPADRVSWGRSSPNSPKNTADKKEEDARSRVGLWTDLEQLGESRSLGSPCRPNRKISRLKTLGHQIRFLRRLEMSLKRRQRLNSPTDSLDSGEETCAASPLLPQSTQATIVAMPPPPPPPPPPSVHPSTAPGAIRTRRYRNKTNNAGAGASAEPLLGDKDRNRPVLIVRQRRAYPE